MSAPLDLAKASAASSLIQSTQITVTKMALRQTHPHHLRLLFMRKIIRILNETPETLSPELYFI